MPNQVTLSVPRVGQVLGDLYGKEVEQEFESFMQSKNLGGNVTVYQGNSGDGLVSVRYNYWAENQQLTGLLRFHDWGSVNTGEQTWLENAERQGEVWKTINSVLITLAFGVGELSLQPPNREPDGVLEGAARVYRASNDGTRKEVLNKKTDHVLGSVSKFYEIAQGEDQGPGGWDEDDVKQHLDKHLPLIQSYNSSALDGSRLRFEEAQKLLKDVLKEDEGENACLETKQCTQTYTPEPSCSGGGSPVRGVALFFEGTKIGSSEPYCRQEREDRGPKITPLSERY